MTLTTTGTDATTLKDFYGGNGGMAGNITLTFPVAATTSLAVGDLVKLTSGYIVACTATTDVAVGYVTKAVDNSTGAAGDLEVPILVKGIAEIDGVILTASASYDAAFVPFTKVGLATGGQVVASYGGSTAPTVCVGKCLSTQAAVALTDITRTVLVYFDFIGLPDQA